MSALRPIHLIRYGVPGAILLAGVIVMLAGSGSIASAAGMVLIGVALMVYLVNVLTRLAITSQNDRDREQEARDQFARSGRWDAPANAVQQAPAVKPAPAVERARSVERQLRRRPPGRPKRPPGCRQRSEH
jgi:hypothetical protein